MARFEQLLGFMQKVDGLAGQGFQGGVWQLLIGMECLKQCLLAIAPEDIACCFHLSVQSFQAGLERSSFGVGQGGIHDRGSFRRGDIWWL